MYELLKIELREFEVYRNICNDIVECDKETFDSRVDEVSKLTKEYING